MGFLYYIAAFLVSFLLFPFVLKAARKYNLVDSPNVRKLQSDPVPSMGGIVVAAGVFVPLLAAGGGGITISEQLVMAAMLLIGIADDVRDLSATLRFILELVLVCILFFLNYTGQLDSCCNIHPLLLFSLLAILIIAGVGVINAVNMIDGIDGLSSGFGIMASGIFACIFLRTGDTGHAFLSGLCAAALVPFYLHNVFGKRSKMYIGDGGSLFIGSVLVINTYALLIGVQPSAFLLLAAHESEAVIIRTALCLAVLCIPVFDTLRVMTDRIVRGIHPFHADKRHLHHRFIELGFSHFRASSCIITANLFIVGVWYICYLLRLPAAMQLLSVICMGIFTTSGFYYGSQWCERRQNRIYRFLCRLGKSSQLEQTALWLRMQRLLG